MTDWKNNKQNIGFESYGTPADSYRQTTGYPTRNAPPVSSYTTTTTDYNTNSTIPTAPHHDDDYEKQDDAKTKRFDTLLLITAILVLISSIFIFYVLPKLHNPNLIATRYDEKKSITSAKFQNRLKNEFSNQTSSFVAHLVTCYENSILRKQAPSIIMLVYDKETSANSACVARKLIKSLNEAVTGKKLNNDWKKLVIDAKELSGRPDDEAKEELDKDLTEIFSNLKSRVALVEDIQHLPPKSTLLFYAYGDDETSAKYNGVVILLTLELDADSSLASRVGNNAKLTQYVESKLSEKWSKSIDYDQLKPLYTRIANNILLVNHEISCE